MCFKRREKKYTFDDLSEAFKAGIKVDPKILDRPEWYTLFATYFHLWYNPKFNKKK